jgi:transposase
MTVAVTRKEPGAAELRREAGLCRDARAARRMLALALVLEGASRETAARCAGMDRQTLRDWVHRYNAEGLAGLHDRRRPGPRPRLSPEQEAELVTAVERGPDPDRDGVVRWRRVDLQALIEARFAVRLHERTVGKVLRRPALAPLADGLGADAVAPGELAGGLGGAGDLGTDRRGGAGVGVDGEHQAVPPVRGTRSRPSKRQAYASIAQRA